MDTLNALIPAPVRTPWPRLAVVAGLIVIVLVAATVFVGSQPKLPRPFGLAAPGLIGFDSNGAIVVANADGTNRRTLATGTPDLSPTFSPDGRWIAFWARNRFASDSTFRLLVMTPDGTEQHFVGGRFSFEQWSAHDFPLPPIAWAPDSRRLAYSIIDTDRSGGQRIYVVERDRTYPEDLSVRWQATDPVGDPNLPATDPQWSFDGNQIAFQGGASAGAGVHGVYVMNADGTGVHRISVAAGNEFAFVQPQWQPGGNMIAYYAGDPSASNGEHDIYVAAADGSREVRVTTDPADEYFPVWSPDGTRLAFERVVDNATAEIVMVDPDGGDPIVSQALPLDGWPPVWAPDGRSIFAFTVSPAGRNGAIRLSTADGSAEGSMEVAESSGHASWQRVGQ